MRGCGVECDIAGCNVDAMRNTVSSQDLSPELVALLFVDQAGCPGCGKTLRQSTAMLIHKSWMLLDHVLVLAHLLGHLCAHSGWLVDPILVL